MVAIGIDLGTTYFGNVDGGKTTDVILLRMIRINQNNHHMLPITDSERIIGDGAKNQAV